MYNEARLFLKYLMHHQPRKRFGQNFIQDKHVIDDILHAIQPLKTDRMLEIGPGLGALTFPLLNYVDHLTAIEIDTDLHAHLMQQTKHTHHLTLIAADALTVDLTPMGHDLRVVGNLPYNISTPLLFHLLHHCDQIKDIHIMLQKEVVDRLAASPGSKAYGRLSIMTQVQCEVEPLLTVPASAFYPVPQVESAVVRLTPHRPARYADVSIIDLERLVAKAFAMRRKTLANNLKTVISATDISALGLDSTLRPEQISIEAYIQLTNFLSKSCKIKRT